MKKFLKWAAVVIGAGLLGVLLVLIFYPIPEPNEIAIAQTSEVYYADGTTSIGSFGDITRTDVPLSDVPIEVQHAVLAAEDRGFYEHGAIDPVGLARALWNNLTSDSTQGGSTITQQYVKNMFLTSDQTYIRKIKEMIISVKIEFAMSKDEILEGYLNTIYWGRGAYGIEAASQAYFGHPASQLTTAEGIALAAIIQSPNNYDPETNISGLESRMTYVAKGMIEEGWLTAEEAAAIHMPAFVPKASSASNRFGGQVGYIMQTVRSELLAKGFTESQVDGGGLKVITTVEQQGQEAIVASVERNGPKGGTEGLRIGVAAIEPATGGIVAMYGGPDYLLNQLNNATQARGQGGSTFKPYALAAGFENGIELDSLWNGNSPQTIQGYTLQNEGNRSWGTVTMLQATENSINTPYVQMQADIGVGEVIDAAYRAGLPENTPGVEENLTFVLGSASPTPVEMAASYATFATRGVFHEPTILRSVEVNGVPRYEIGLGGQQRFEANIMDNVNYALQRVVSNGTGAKAQALGRPNAGKTGTTDDNKSAWYVGYTPQVVAAVMMVKEDANGNPVSLSGTGGVSQVYGSSFPLSMWLGFAQGYLRDKPVETFVDPAQLLGGVSEPEPLPSESEVPTPEPEASATPEPSDDVEPEPEPSPTIEQPPLPPVESPQP